MPLNGQISKDDRLRLCENAMLNIDELDAICGREMNIVKSLLTSTDVNERAAYGRLMDARRGSQPHCTGARWASGYI
jgi:predicted P-loop ATPase